MLTTAKPHLTGSEKKLLRKNKWEHATFVMKDLKRIGIDAIMFEKSTGTPHIRALYAIDYWPASTRFFDHDLKVWGLGYTAFRNHAVTVYERIQQLQHLQSINT